MKVLLVSFLFLACDSDDEAATGPGALGFECYVNLTCNPGLECTTDRICAPGADVVEVDDGDVGDAETAGPLDTDTGPDTAIDTGDPLETRNPIDY